MIPTTRKRMVCNTPKRARCKVARLLLLLAALQQAPGTITRSPALGRHRPQNPGRGLPRQDRAMRSRRGISKTRRCDAPVHISPDHARADSTLHRRRPTPHRTFPIRPTADRPNLRSRSVCLCWDIDTTAVMMIRKAVLLDVHRALPRAGKRRTTCRGSNSRRR